MYGIQGLLEQNPAAPQSQSMNPAAVPTTTAPVVRIGKHATDGEPGGGTRSRASAASLRENPTTWLIVTLALGLALGYYATGG